MWRIGRFVAGVVAMVGIYSFSLGWINLFREVSLTPSIRLSAYGFAAGSLLWIFLGRVLRFFQNFEHEITHLLVGLLFLKRPHAIFASEDQGGVVSLYGSNFIITLAPYFLPTFSLLVLPFFPLFQSDFHAYLYVALSFVTGYHVVSTLQEFSFRQPDIQTSGIIFSVLFCLFANLAILGFLVAFVSGGLSGGGEFLLSGFKAGVLSISLVVREFRSYLPR